MHILMIEIENIHGVKTWIQEPTLEQIIKQPANPLALTGRKGFIEVESIPVFAGTLHRIAKAQLG